MSKNTGCLQFYLGQISVGSTEDFQEISIKCTDLTSQLHGSHDFRCLIVELLKDPSAKQVFKEMYIEFMQSNDGKKIITENFFTFFKNPEGERLFSNSLEQILNNPIGIDIFKTTLKSVFKDPKIFDELKKEFIIELKKEGRLKFIGFSLFGITGSITFYKCLPFLWRILTGIISKSNA